MTYTSRRARWWSQSRARWCSAPRNSRCALPMRDPPAGRWTEGCGVRGLKDDTIYTWPPGRAGTPKRRTAASTGGRLTRGCPPKTPGDSRSIRPTPVPWWYPLPPARTIARPMVAGGGLAPPPKPAGRPLPPAAPPHRRTAAPPHRRTAEGPTARPAGAVAPCRWASPGLGHARTRVGHEPGGGPRVYAAPLRDALYAFGQRWPPAAGPGGYGAGRCALRALDAVPGD